MSCSVFSSPVPGAQSRPPGPFVVFKKSCHCNHKIINKCQLYHLSLPIIYKQDHDQFSLNDGREANIKMFVAAD